MPTTKIGTEVVADDIRGIYAGVVAAEWIRGMQNEGYHVSGAPDSVEEILELLEGGPDGEWYDDACGDLDGLRLINGLYEYKMYWREGTVFVDVFVRDF